MKRRDVGEVRQRRDGTVETEQTNCIIDAVRSKAAGNFGR